MAKYTFMALCPQINALYYEAKSFLGIESSEGQKVKHSVMNQYSILYFDQQHTLENHIKNENLHKDRGK